MARLQAKSLENPDEVRQTPFGHIDIYNLDDLVIGRMVFEPGWHWLEHVQPIAGTSLCQYHHVGICIAGRLANRLEDGTTSEIGPGMVFEIPPGHDGSGLTFVDAGTHELKGVSGTRQLYCLAEPGRG